MKFIITKSTLLEALAMAGKCIPQSATIPILKNYLFKIDGDSLTITGSNLEVQLSKRITIEGNEFEALIAVPKTRLLTLVSSLPEQPLQFTINKKVPIDIPEYSISIKADCGTYHIPVEDGADYPNPETKDEITFSIKGDDLRTGIDKTIFACSTDELRPAFCGVLLSFEDEQLTYTSTNTKILSTWTFTGIVHTLPAGKKKDIIIPKKALAILESLAMDKTIPVKMDAKSIVFNVNETTVVYCRLIDEKYANYKAVIPGSNDKTLEVDLDHLVSALNRVCLFANDKTNAVKLDVSGLAIELSAENDMGEIARETLEYIYTGDPLIIGFDGKQLLAGLHKLNTGSNINISLSTPNRHFLVHHKGSDTTDPRNLLLMMSSVI